MPEPIVPTPVVEDPTPERTFTQVEVDALVSRRLARAMKGMPSEEELANFRTWQNDQQTHRTTIETLTTERDTARGRVTALETELSQVKQANYVQSKGFSGDDAEFVIFKAAKMVDDKTTFEQAVDKIAEDRKQKPSFDWSAPVGEGTKENTASSVMNALIRGARK